MVRLAEFKALTFDCYGTLIDWESGLLQAFRPWLTRHRVTVDNDRLLQLFARAESATQQETPSARYQDILRDVLKRIAKELKSPATDTDAGAFAKSVGEWPPFPDTVKVLKQLKQTHKLVIISNVDRESFARTNRRLEVEFDAIVTAEDVGAYKPDHRMFLRAFEVLASMGIKRDQILHVAQSLYHDHIPGKELGLTTAWIDRRRGKPGGATAVPQSDVTPDLTVHSLLELAQLAG